MTKHLFSLIFVFGLISCNTKTESDDYFGQTTPDSIPVIFAPHIISVNDRFEHGISFAPDRQELTFGVLDKNDFSGLIYYSEKSNNMWTEPKVFEPLQNESAFLPYFTPDGKSLIYTQSRPDTANGLTDIWIINKKGDSWINARKMNSPLSSLSRESTACMTYDRKIYFSSNRNGNGLADLYYSSLKNGEYLKINNLSPINTVRGEESIFTSPNDTYTIFSRYATNQNGPDLYISYRDFKGNWIQPTLLGAAINSSDWERRPFVSIDNRYLFFTRSTFEEKGMIESDIYWVNTKRVFKPFIYNPLSDTTVKVGEKIEILIPEDYFQDIDDKISFEVNANEIDWLEFDNGRNVLSGTPTKMGEFKLQFTAVDKNLNTTLDMVVLTVLN